MFIAPMFVGQGDTNRDGKLSTSEFKALAEKWFAACDKTKSGKLTEAQLRTGLNAVASAGGAGGGGPMPFGLQARDGKRNGVVGMMGMEFKYVHAEMEFEGKRLPDVGLRYKGNGTFLESRASLKRSLKIDINRYTKGQEFAGVTTLNLHNNVTDASSMNEPLAFLAYREAGVPAPRSSYARVYVTVPGKYNRQYLGLYSLIENLDKKFMKERFGTSEGALFKPSTSTLFNDQGDDWKAYIQGYDPKTKLTKAQERRIIELCKLVTHANDTEFAAKIGNYLDLNTFARYMAVLVWIVDYDSILDLGQNFLIYLDPKTNKLHFVAWDQDHSFGQFPMMGSQEDREKLSLKQPWMGEKRFLERIFKIEAFRKNYLAHVAKLNQTLFTPERFAKQVDELAPVLRPAVKEEAEAKLARFDKAVAGEPVPPAPGSFGGPPPGEGGGRPGGGPPPGGGFGGPPGGFSFMQPAKPIKSFVKARAASVAQQIAGKSEGAPRSNGFGPPPAPGGRGGGGGGEGFGPGMFLAPPFLRELDANKDKILTRGEFIAGFAKWFAAWNTDKSGVLSDKQLRDGIDRALSLFPGGGPPPDFLPDFE
jgi:hypothetical protein